MLSLGFLEELLLPLLLLPSTCRTDGDGDGATGGGAAGGGAAAAAGGGGAAATAAAAADEPMAAL